MKTFLYRIAGMFLIILASACTATNSITQKQLQTTSVRATAIVTELHALETVNAENADAISSEIHAHRVMVLAILSNYGIVGHFNHDGTKILIDGIEVGSIAEGFKLEAGIQIIEINEVPPRETIMISDGFSISYMQNGTKVTVFLKKQGG